MTRNTPASSSPPRKAAPRARAELRRGDYIKLFAAVSLVTTGAAALVHPEAADLEQLVRPLPFTRDVLRGQFPGFEIKGSLFDNSLSLHEGRQGRLRLLGAPTTTAFRVTASVRRAHNHGFRLYLARAGGQRRFFQYSSVSVKDNGLFTEQGSQIHQVLRADEVQRSTEKALHVELQIDVRGRSLTATINGRTLRGSWPDAEGVLDLELVPIRPGNRALVDRLAVWDMSGDAPRPVASSAFVGSLFYLFDLPRALGLQPRSRLVRALGLVLLAGGALLLDLLLLWLVRVARLRRWSLLTAAGALFLLTPLQGALVLALRSGLRLPYLSALACLAAVLLLKALVLARFGCGRPARPTGRARLLPPLLGAVGLAAHLLATAWLWSWQGDPLSTLRATALHDPWIYTLFVAAAPIIAAASAWALSRPLPLEGLLLVAAQYGAVLLFPPLPDSLSTFMFFVAALVPWIIFTLVHVARRPERGSLLKAAHAVVAVALLLGCAELGLRSIAFLDNYFNSQSLIKMYSWDIARHTNLFNNQRQRQKFTIKGRAFTRKKAPGVLRVVCLGSSSTAGSGASDTTRFSYPAQLQRVLDQQAGQRVEVINGGIPGVFFYTLRVYLEDVLMRLEPDVVVVYFGLNKDSRDARRFHQAMQAEMVQNPQIGNERQMWAALQLRHNPTAVIDALLGMIEYRAFVGAVLLVNELRTLGQDRQQRVEQGQSDQRHRWLTANEVVQISRRGEAKVLLLPEVNRFHVLSLRPGETPSEGDYYQLFARLARKHAGNGVQQQSLLRYWDAQKVYSYLRDDVHMNDAGYRYLAGVVAQVLFSKGLVKRKAGDAAAGTQP